MRNPPVRADHRELRACEGELGMGLTESRGQPKLKLEDGLWWIVIQEGPPNGDLQVAVLTPLSPATEIAAAI